MSLIELKELVNMENVYVGSHSFNHIKLNELEEKIISELKDSKNFRTKIICRSKHNILSFWRN